MWNPLPRASVDVLVMAQGGAATMPVYIIRAPLRLAPTSPYSAILKLAGGLAGPNGDDAAAEELQFGEDRGAGESVARAELGRGQEDATPNDQEWAQGAGVEDELDSLVSPSEQALARPQQQQQLHNEVDADDDEDAQLPEWRYTLTGRSLALHESDLAMREMHKLMQRAEDYILEGRSVDAVHKKMLFLIETQSWRANVAKKRFPEARPAKRQRQG